MKSGIFSKKNIFNLLLLLVAVVIVVYFIVMIFSANLNKVTGLETELATKYSYSESILTDSYVVRNEKLLTYDGSKVLYYTVDDGDIVSVGSQVALVFANENDALAYNKIKELERQISTLKSLNTSYENVKTDFEAIDKQIDLNIKSIIRNVNAGDRVKAESYADNFIHSVNQRQVLTGAVLNFDDKINELEAQIASYKQSGGSYIDTITSDVSGYFVSKVDGYENVYNYENVADTDIESFCSDAKSQPIGDSVIGKIVSGLNWYVVCKLSPDDALNLSHSNTKTTLSFIGTPCVDIPATLKELNQQSKQSEAVAVFECNYMNTSISHLRNENVQIRINSFTGIRISKEAIHDDYVEFENDRGELVSEKVQGVYVLYGGKVLFKEISVKFSGNDFVIVEPDVQEAILRSGVTVKYNDEIIVKGENLYAGKTIS